MGLDSCGRLIKRATLVANVLILVGGISIMAVGSWTCADRGHLQELLGNDMYMRSAYILIVIGTFMILISFLGCFGTVKENKCLLLIYFVFLFLMFIVLLIDGTLGYIFEDQVKETTTDTMLISMARDYDNKLSAQYSWDTLQEQMKCCGISIDGKPPYEAWKHSQKFRTLNGPPHVPASCCLRTPGGDYVNKEECQKANPSNFTVYTYNCYDAILYAAEANAAVLGGIGIGISCLVLLGIILSCALFNAIK